MSVLVLAITTGKKKLQSSVWRVVLLCQFLVLEGNWQFICCGGKVLLRPEKKSSSRLSGRCAIIITTGKKKIQSSVWRVRDHYYDRKKRYSRLSGGCAIIITTGKKRYSCLSGGLCCCVNRLRPEKKSSSRLSGGLCYVMNLY